MKRIPLVKTRAWLLGLSLLCTCVVLGCGGESQPSADSANDGVELALYPSNPRIAQQTAQQFSLRALDEEGKLRDLTSVTSWRVSDERGDVVVMPESGLLALDQPGRYLVTASYRGRELTTALTVTAATVKSVAVSPITPSIAKGVTQQFTTVATFSDGTTQDVSSLTTWSVKDVSGTGVATIDTAGLLLAQNVGQATVTTRYKSRSASTKVTVTAAALVALAIGPPAPMIAKGSSQRFTASGIFSDRTTVDLTTVVTWSVSDVMGTGVASSDGSGLITGKAVGTALVSAAFLGVSGQTSITVTAATPVSLAVNPSSSAIANGTKQRFAAIATLSDGTTQDVTALAAWTARDTMGSSVASINSSGVATATGMGSATISCAYRGSTATATLTVTPAVLVGIEISPSPATVYQGYSTQLTAAGVYSDGTTQALTSPVAWTAADLRGKDVAAVSSGGMLLGKNPGTATITATSQGFSARTVAMVNTVVYTRVDIAPIAWVVRVGSRQQFLATAGLGDGSVEEVTAKTTWTSNNPSVASIDSAGRATANATGSATIVGEFGHLRQFVSVRILP